MITRFAFLGWIFAAPAMAASLVLSNDPATGGPGKFAAEEIRRETVVHGMTLGEDATATRVALTVEMDGKASAQSYSVRVKNDGGRRTRGSSKCQPASNRNFSAIRAMPVGLRRMHSKRQFLPSSAWKEEREGAA